MAERKKVRWGWPPNKSVYLNGLLVRYGVTSSTLDRVWKEQHGRCGVCREVLAWPLRNAAEEGWELKIDSRGEERKDLRGLLCSECRIRVRALLKESLLNAAAIRYLEDKGDWPDESV